MRSYARLRNRRGFTLVELMIVVAIIGILAALAIYGVNRYLNSAKTAEAKQTVGAISRAAAAAWERKITPSEMLPDGSTGNASAQELCDDAIPVPAAPPAGVKYQPSTAVATDFNQGTSTAGWQCLRFSMTQPILYSYDYQKDSAVHSTAAGAPDPSTGATAYFETAARGDLNADGTLYSYFVRSGSVITVVGAGAQLKLSTELAIKDEYE